MIAQVVDELFHLVSDRMRLYQRHALDVSAGPRARVFNRLEQIAPPQSLFGRLRLRNVKAERMPQTIRVGLIRDHCHIEKRSRHQFIRKDSGLADMQTARAGKDHRAALLNAYGLITF